MSASENTSDHTPLTVVQERTMNPYVYLNKYGDRYTIHACTLAKGRKPRFVMRKRVENGLPKIPAGYEIRENVHGQVFIRLRRPTGLLSEEVVLLREAMRRYETRGYALDIERNAATIFASSLDSRRFAEIFDDVFAEGFESALAEKLPGDFTPELRRMFREHRRSENSKRPKYYPLLRFVNIDKKERMFSVERVCFTGASDWLTLEKMPLPAALMKYLSRLGDDSLFDLL